MAEKQPGEPRTDRFGRIYIYWGVALAILIVLGVLLVVAWGKAPPLREASAESDGLRLTLTTAKSEYQEQESIDLTVLFTNVGEDRIIVLPHFSKLSFDGPGAEYSPFPVGPVPIKPCSLAPGETKRVDFIGLKVWSGVWLLKPGSYEVRAILALPEKTLRNQGWPWPDDIWTKSNKKPKGRMWMGHLETGAIPLQVRAK